MALEYRAWCAVVVAALSVGACSGTSGVPPSVVPTVVDVAVKPARVVGGDLSALGTVTLSTAPTTGVTVLLSTDSTFAFVPSAFTIPAGATSGTFPIATTAVLRSAVATISAAANNSTRSGVLTLTSGLAANFAVTSLSPALTKSAIDPIATPVADRGAGTADTCPLVANGGSPVLDCQFNGAPSTSLGFPITGYSWTYAFGGQVRTEESSSPVFKPTATGCGFFANQAGPFGPFIEMTVTLRVLNVAGGTSDEATNRNVRIYPAGLCGYGF